MATAAIIGGVGSLLGGITGGKGAAKAAKIQAQAAEDAINEQRNEFAQTQTNEAPFLNFGTSGIGPLGDLLGLNGNSAQQDAYNSIEASPAFTSAIGVGNDAILQNAAATGGLRGGNINNPLLSGSLPNYDQSLLASLVNNQIGNLSGVVNTGASTAAGLGQLGQSNANSISSLLTQQGNANATGAAAPYAAIQSALQGLSGSASQYSSQNNLLKLLQQSSGGASYNTAGPLF